MSFFCKDEWFQPVLNDPHAYVEKLRQYECVIGMDCSPFDNMPAWIADHQIGMNLMYDFFTDKEFIRHAKPVCREIMRDLQDLVRGKGFTCQFFGEVGFKQQTILN